MPLAPVDLKSDVYRILAWSIFLPALVVWPFLSAMPAIALLGGGLTVPAISINVMMLLTGFWPIFGAYIAYVYAQSNTEAGVYRASSQRGLQLGAYSLAWTGLYLAIALAAR